jgi:NTE family protein
MHRILLVLISSCLSLSALAQGVGLVLSGGGASGFAHIGVLKALEENEIPINYITGTSAGALVGAMYASGYSPTEIKEYVTSARFQLMAAGKVEKKHDFLLRKDDPNASGVYFRFRLDSLFRNSIPTNFIKPELLDFEMLRIFGITGASMNQNFDSLFIPFRCVASDIVAKKSVAFKNGKLNEAVRASMTFPFYINPIRINGVLYFDGGLYNNFPADQMYHEFPVEFIIGSNVSFNAPAPKEGDIISQVTNMLVSHTDFTIPCDEGIIISPKLDLNTFEFKSVSEAIEAGYKATLQLIDSIKHAVPERVSVESLTQQRAAFRKRVIPFVISEVNTVNQKEKDESYIRKSILKNSRKETIDLDRFKRRYFRTYASPQIEYLFPTVRLKQDSTFAVDIKVREAKPFRVDFGGLLSTRAVNTGFVQLSYERLDRVASMYQVGGYFGKFYNSGKANINLFFPSYYPITSSFYGVINHWDYFKSFSTFFAKEKPSFLVQNEYYIGAEVKFPILNNSKFAIDYRRFETQDKYFQTDYFTNIDTSDFTRLSGNTVSFELEHNSLNRKQFASSGLLLKAQIRMSDAFERSISGSTSLFKYDYTKYHQWFNFRGEAQGFPLSTKYFSFGLHFLASITNLALLKNYTATLLNMNAFAPLPDMQTYFLKEHRSPQYVGAGVNVIFSLRKNIDFRFDGYWYQPFISITRFDDGTFGYSKPFKGESLVLSGSAIYHSPIGPIRGTLNYFPQQKNPIQLQLSYGFVLFNERAFR